MFWILDEEGIPKSVPSEEWAVFFEKVENRRIAYYERDGYWVSTVFLGLDHNWSDKGPPILFETMMFDDTRERLEVTLPNGAKSTLQSCGGEMDCERSCTKDDALIVHERFVKKLDKKLDEAYAMAMEFIKPDSA